MPVLVLLVGPRTTTPPLPLRGDRLRRPRRRRDEDEEAPPTVADLACRASRTRRGVCSVTPPSPPVAPVARKRRCEDVDLAWRLRHAGRIGCVRGVLSSCGAAEVDADVEGTADWVLRWGVRCDEEEEEDVCAAGRRSDAFMVCSVGSMAGDSPGYVRVCLHVVV